MNALESLLTQNLYLLADGAMGTMLMSAGLGHGEAPERWNLSHPDQVRAVHRNYIQAGSQIILTNSFGGSRFRLKLHDLQDRVSELNRVAAALARAEADAAPHPVAVAGSIGPSGELFEPMGLLNFDEARDGFAEQAAALVEGGVDALWIETMSDLQEAKAAVEGAQKGCQLPIFCTFSFDAHGHTSMGVSPAQAAQTMADIGVPATGANCGQAPEDLLDLLPQMRAAAPDAYLIAKPNAGVPRMVNREVVYDATPERMGELAQRYVELGARIVGGCCGSTPAHIAAIAAALQ